MMLRSKDNKEENHVKRVKAFESLNEDIGAYITSVDKYATSKWKGEKVSSTDLQYLKAAIEYAKAEKIVFNKSLLVKAIDDLTNWVLYEQYVSYAKKNHPKGEKYGAGRIDYYKYSGIALREISNETVKYGATGIAVAPDRLNNYFWTIVEMLKNELIDKYKSIQSGERVKYGDHFKYHLAVYERLFRKKQTDLGTKKMLCDFLIELYGWKQIGES
jgi:hypothetical protein